MKRFASSFFWLALLAPHPAFGADKLLGVHSARVLSQSMPWIAEEAGLFRKYDLEFPLVYIGSSPLATAAMLGGDGELLMDGGLGIVRAYVQGNTELICIGGQKNILTQSILAKPPIKKLEDLKGKKIGVTRIGATTHYFATHAFRRVGMEAGRDYTMIQTGGAPEMLAALVSGTIDAGTLSSPGDAQAIALGYQYIVYGPDLRIPQVAVGFMTRRTTLAKRPQVLGRFMRVMAEAAKILHTDKEFTFKVLAKQLRISDRNALEAGYNAEIKALEPRLTIRPEAFQAVLDDVAPGDPRAKKIKPEVFIDRRFLDEMTKTGFFDKLWGEK
ncbi:MAG TPA: ABC transporter substrate-binding protein [Candidatus Binatia bacterium]|nr:ABC transporter substrate-binding protein [Candidatus Binatia bacterium]